MALLLRCPSGSLPGSRRRSALSGVDAERHTEIAGNAEAPNALPIADQRVHLPRWERAQFRWVLHVVEEGQHFAKLVYRIGPEHPLRCPPRRVPSEPCGRNFVFAPEKL